MSSKINKKLSTTLIISFFILFFLILRGYALEHSSLWIDEGYTINASLSILEKGIPVLDSGNFYRQGILYNYISAGLMSIFGFDAFSPITPRIPALIFGLLSIFALFLLAKKLYNKNIALLSSLLLGFSTWHIAWSQQARGYTGLMFFIILSFYFLYIFLKEKSPKNLIFFSLSFLGAYLSHTMAVIFIPSFLIIIITHAIIYPNSFPIQLKKLNLSSLRSPYTLATLTSLIIFTAIIHTSLPRVTVYGFYKEYLPFITNEMLLLSVFSFLGAVMSVNKKNLFPSLFLIAAFFFPFLIILQFGPMAHVRYLFPLFFIPLIFFSYFIFFLLKITPLKKIKYKLPLAIIISSIILFSNLTFIPQKHYSLEWGSPQPNFKEVYKIIKEKPPKLIISPYTHLNKIYLNEKGLSLPISLSGRITDMKKLTINKDYYTGADTITSKEHLLTTLDKNTGFLILDEMAKIRLKEQFKAEEFSHPKLREIYHSGKDFNSIWLYEF